MELRTKYHGVVQVDESNFIYFENGIPGFLDEKYFILLPLEANNPLFIMQSKATPELGFIIVNPFIFFSNYEFELHENEKDVLSITKEDDVDVFTILTIKDPFSNSTANLQAPIIINNKKNVAKQIILHDSEYRTRHEIISNNQ